MPRKPREVIVQLTLSEGYEDRFTRACLKQATKREEFQQLLRGEITLEEINNKRKEVG